MPTGEDAHGPDYFTPVFLLPQLCNSTDARESATQAGIDAAEAQIDADNAYAAANQLHLSQLAEVQASADFGEIPPAPQLWDFIKEEIGPAALTAIQEITGYADVMACFGGEVSGCLWLIAGAFPIGKAAAAVKAAPALRQLIAKSGTIFERWKEAKAARVNAVESAASCALTRRMARTSEKPVNCKDIAVSTTHAYRVQVSKIKDESDFDLVATWRPESGLTTPQSVADIPFTPAQKDRLNELVETEKIKSVNNGIMSVPETIVTRVDNHRNRTYKPNRPNAGFVAKSSAFSADKLKEMGASFGGHIFRKVSQDKAQNQFARLISMRQAEFRNNEVRMDHAVVRRVEERKWEKANTTRPDIQVTQWGSNGASHNISYEFDRPPNARVEDHIQNYLTAHPNGIIVLFEMETDLMEVSQRTALEKLSKKVTGDWVEKNLPKKDAPREANHA